MLQRLQTICAIFVYRMDSLEQFVSFSLLIGQTKVYQSQEKDSLISLVRCTKQRNSLDKMVPSQFIAGMVYIIELLIRL